MMEIQVNRAEFRDVEAMRELYRREANCQIIHDSALSRGMADAFVIQVAGQVGGYGAVWNKHYPHRIMEFFALSDFHNLTRSMFRELLAASKATHIEAQTNIPLMLSMLNEFATNSTTEHLLFEDAFTSHLDGRDGFFRPVNPAEKAALFSHTVEPVGDWGIESNGTIIATGGYFSHYNPPYVDIFMEVVEPARRQGFGSYLVQELKRVCRDAGKKPAARCKPANDSSRRTLEKAGFRQCGEMLAGEVKSASRC